MNQDANIASAKAGVARVKFDLLARALPALSYAAAVDRVPSLGDERNFNMEARGRPLGGPWPSDGHSDQNAGRLLHSDFRDVALPYVQLMYQEMIQRGGLSQ